MNREEKILMFRNRLAKVFRHIEKQARRLHISCFRVYDHDLPEFPFCIDIYDNKLYVAEYKRRHGMTEAEHEDWIGDSIRIIREIIPVKEENIFLKLRQRKPGRPGQYQRLDETGHEFIIEENGLKFIVNLSDYLDTGLFLDHRITRQMIRDDSRRKKVLNLFAYTGSFSVNAAAGGAERVVSVDLSKNYLGWAQRNFIVNDLKDEDKYVFINTDAVEYLKTIAPGYFDMIILDPPTFSNSKRMQDFLDVQRDHVSLINQCLVGMKKDGALYFSTNFSKFILDKESIKATSIKDITSITTPFDFRTKLSRQCYLIRR